MSQSESAYCPVSRSMRRVRDAIVTSVRWSPAAGQVPDHQGIDSPRGSSPPTARGRPPGTLSRIQAILVAEK